MSRAFALFCQILTISITTLAIEATCAEDRPPNIVMIISDDQGWGDFGFMGHAEIKTPNLDQLARESLVFQRGYVPDSLCRASLATIISGRYPRQHKIVGNDPKIPDELKNVPSATIMTDPRYVQLREKYITHIDSVKTLPMRLKPLGYTSLQTGKWWEGNFQRGGFDQGMTHGDMMRGARHGDEGLRIGREGLEPIEKFVSESAKQSEPFFVWYAPMMPHAPHNPPQRLLDKYIDKTPHLPVAKYWAMCEWFDETIGELKKILERNHVVENTVILFVCDNGWINDTQSSQYAPRSKRTPYEGGIRTPIMIHWPGHIQPRMDTTHLASSIDLVPTALHVAGLPADPELPGINLLDTTAVEKRESIFGEVYDHDAVSIEDPRPSLRYRWVINNTWKLIQPISNPSESSLPLKLYNLSRDPTEQTDQSDREPAVVEKLLLLLTQQWPSDA